MKRIIKIEIIRRDGASPSSDVYFVPEHIQLSIDDVKKFKIANPAWQVIAHCDPDHETFEVFL
jgi:hypothetical protein